MNLTPTQRRALPSFIGRIGAALADLQEAARRREAYEALQTEMRELEAKIAKAQDRHQRGQLAILLDMAKRVRREMLKIEVTR